jgi:hypothetical protein
MWQTSGVFGLTNGHVIGRVGLSVTKLPHACDSAHERLHAASRKESFEGRIVKSAAAANRQPNLSLQKQRMHSNVHLYMYLHEIWSV